MARLISPRFQKHTVAQEETRKYTKRGRKKKIKPDFKQRDGWPLVCIQDSSEGQNMKKMKLKTCEDTTKAFEKSLRTRLTHLFLRMMNVGYVHIQHIFFSSHIQHIC